MVAPTIKISNAQKPVGAIHNVCEANLRLAKQSPFRTVNLRSKYGRTLPTITTSNPPHLFPLGTPKRPDAMRRGVWFI